eukprot:scaffold99734_cov84-Phaeocystis_antarctica.AAC.2
MSAHSSPTRIGSSFFLTTVGVAPPVCTRLKTACHGVASHSKTPSRAGEPCRLTRAAASRADGPCLAWVKSRSFSTSVPNGAATSRSTDPSASAASASRVSRSVDSSFFASCSRLCVTRERCRRIAASCATISFCTNRSIWRQSLRPSSRNSPACSGKSTHRAALTSSATGVSLSCEASCRSSARPCTGPCSSRRPPCSVITSIARDSRSRCSNPASAADCCSASSSVSSIAACSMKSSSACCSIPSRRSPLLALTPAKPLHTVVCASYGLYCTSAFSKSGDLSVKPRASRERRS